MDHYPYSTGNWMVIPNAPTQNPTASIAPSAQEHSQHIHQQQQQQHHHHQSLASHFHLLPLVESLAEATENGTRDMHSDALALVNELTSQFDKCQQLLNSISESIKTKVMTVDGQKHKLEDSEQLINQRRDLISNYRSCIEDLIKSDCNK